MLPLKQLSDRCELEKMEVLNAIDAEMKRRNSYQGKYTVISERKFSINATNSPTF